MLLLNHLIDTDKLLGSVSLENVIIIGLITLALVFAILSYHKRRTTTNSWFLLAIACFWMGIIIYVGHQPTSTTTTPVVPEYTTTKQVISTEPLEGDVYYHHMSSDYSYRYSTAVKVPTLTTMVVTKQLANSDELTTHYSKEEIKQLQEDASNDVKVIEVIYLPVPVG